MSSSQLITRRNVPLLYRSEIHMHMHMHIYMNNKTKDSLARTLCHPTMLQSVRTEPGQTFYIAEWCVRLCTITLFVFNSLNIFLSQFIRCAFRAPSQLVNAAIYER